MTTSLLQALGGIGEPAKQPLAIPSAFGGRMSASLQEAMEGMTDPGVAGWNKVGVALYSENTDLSEEAQGAATDGNLWYVCSNEIKGVITFDNNAERVGEFHPTAGIMNQMWKDEGSPGSGWDPHFGAPGFFEGWIHVPIQGPRGVWRFRADGSDQVWRKAQALPDNDLFPWCAIHPKTRVLYTSNYRKPSHLYAYDRETLKRLDMHDIAIGGGPIHLDRVQGGVFTKHGRFILVRCDYNAVFCYSSLNGHCFGAKKLGDFDSDGSEVESVAVRSWQFGETSAHVHILELDNDLPSGDDFYLHSFRVPDPSRL